METVFGANATWACPTEELLIDDETRTVEYKQTARWNVREQRRDRTMEQVVVKTVAGLLNDRGGTLLIGVTDSREPVGLDADYAQVKPPNADGYVNWLDTLFENNLGHAGANRLDIRIDRVDRIDIPASSRPIWVKTKKGADALYQRRNNSTRQVPPAEIEAFITERSGQQEPGHRREALPRQVATESCLTLTCPISDNRRVPRRGEQPRPDGPSHQLGLFLCQGPPKPPQPVGIRRGVR